MTSDDELRRLAEAATPGPWFAHEAKRSANTKYRWVGRRHHQQNGSGVCRIIGDPGPPDRKDADAAYIAAANPAAILALLDRLRDAEAREARLREALEAAPDAIDAAYSQALDEEQGNDFSAERHRKDVASWKAMRRAALAEPQP